MNYGENLIRTIRRMLSQATQRLVGVRPATGLRHGNEERAT
jgi:hypothetical protein